MLTVAKFGGTSVADFDAMVRCANIVKDRADIRVVVVSASAGVTNHLVTLSQQILPVPEQQSILGKIANIQYAISDCLPDKDEANVEIDAIIEQLAQLVTEQNTLQTAKTADAILSCGEQMSSRLFARVLRQIECQGAYFDIGNVMTTNSLYGKAVVDTQALAVNCQQLLTPQLQDVVTVTQGFIGRDSMGNTTTLGRGGSDYSAALIAEAINADDLQIWTDVVGIFTTDPRIAKSARAIDEISFGEAAEMATFGAKILHPATLIPAIRSSIPVFVGSSREPQAGGTRIMETVSSKPTYRSIALRRQQTLVTVKSPAMLHASGFLAKVFAILASHELSVDLITTSEISVALTFDNPPGSTQAGITQKVVEELEQLCDVRVENNLSLIAVIGNGLLRSQGVGTQVFDTIPQANVRMICHGASDNNLCFLVPEHEGEHVVQTLHDNLFV
ncbi:lysine-sensitive aspartokinase 3 [Thalassotalea mangrovi]|uniref:Aspartokinase n=1 Tax=Thalassotalea mangrovi TaxID=2572245 RepID=A0A4U1B3X7_9GAMM|nr:lysine-sensitive aspartokinase 3 [Thalassotalea mangrovi]TKB44773.1 lysine-sensitive aspartokinase 3 [Thalassotalea mangrovi]